ncbi:SH3 domain-containing protein [Calothrix sp. 336/3]|uniref:SH3 domain-containing protein n=1 Tax=Calothrix sp. 336/3 TaxID=1337936 RepID=UPI0004E336F1|nr:SH3 domain-containing protein [Calothrix sp. 336/3]AKG22233.1 hypothetical protein IJ00_14035 [Calothrix sp. 336/3]
MIKHLIISTVITSLTSTVAQAQSTASVFAPPSNIRNAPSGEIICTINKKITLEVSQQQNGWYYTSLCGGGYIHKSQIRFQNSNKNISNQAKVVGIKQGQLALRNLPNGRSLAGLNNGNVVNILAQQGNWAYVEVINGPNAKINGMRGWVNSYYLALF